MTVAELFDRAAQRYDQAQRQLVPCFDELWYRFAMYSGEKLGSEHP